MTYYLGSDHAGIELKEAILNLLKAKGVKTEDCGPFSTDSVDYPDYAAKVAAKVLAHPDSFGVLMCGTGIGISIAANKIRGIRAALCHNRTTAQMARAHNNANVLVLGARILKEGEALAIVEAFLETPFEGGRHQRRIQKIHDLEERDV